MVLHVEAVLSLKMKRLCETQLYNLKRKGTPWCQRETAPLDSARQSKPDLLVLDLMLPSLDGFEVCRILRREMNMPILMLTARDDEIDRVVGLEMGADDYLTKPFSMRELIARVKAHLRRTRLILDQTAAGPAPDPLRQDALVFDGLVINRTRREVTLNGQVLQLKPQEYDLLLFFAQHKGRMLSREFILERVWGWEYIGDSRTVDVHVRWLRQKIEADSAHPVRIVTVRGGDTGSKDNRHVSPNLRESHAANGQIHHIGPD
jgi:DNA-binding response OmpR family regulator